jgi:hypothetical protein
MISKRWNLLDDAPNMQFVSVAGFNHPDLILSIDDFDNRFHKQVLEEEVDDVGFSPIAAGKDEARYCCVFVN